MGWRSGQEAWFLKERARGREDRVEGGGIVCDGQRVAPLGGEWREMKALGGGPREGGWLTVRRDRGEWARAARGLFQA